jgi:hypothetical protein
MFPSPEIHSEGKGKKPVNSSVWTLPFINSQPFQCQILEAAGTEVAKTGEILSSWYYILNGESTTENI